MPLEALRLADLADLDGPPPLTDAEAEEIIERHNRRAAFAETIRVNAEALIRREQDACASILAEHGARLEEWVRGRLRGKSRSVRTLAGVAGFRRVPDRVVVLDEGAALVWAREHLPAAVRERVDAKAVPLWTLQQADFSTGELTYVAPPGLSVVEGRDTFYVKPVSRPRAPGQEDSDDDA